MIEDIAAPLLAGYDLEPVRETAARLLDRHLPAARRRELDESGAFPRDVWQRLGAAGLLVIDGPDPARTAAAALVTFEIARRLPSLAVDYALGGMFGRTLADPRVTAPPGWPAEVAAGTRLVAYGMTEPGGGTDLLALRTTATETPDGWSVTGAKTWISLAAEADLILVLARTDPPDPPHRRASGLSLIAVPTDQPGVTVRRIPLAGMRAAGTCEVFLDGAVAPRTHLVGPRGAAMRLLRDTLSVERVLAACISLGIGAGALAHAVGYAGQRTAFGRPIGAFQAVAHPLAASAAELVAAGALVERAVAATAADGAGTTTAPGTAASEADLAKWVAAETAARVTDRVMRAGGAHALATETAAQMFFRDARLALFSPVSNEMVLNVVAERLGLPRSY